VTNEDRLGTRTRNRNLVGRLWQFVKRQIIDDAPEELAICQFDCHKGQCTEAEWKTCERRVRKGAGELFPDSRLRSANRRSGTTRESNPLR
jgi:hypothetical protein